MEKPCLAHAWSAWRIAYVRVTDDFTRIVRERTCTACGKTETEPVKSADVPHVFG
jgi:hypothetical protein